MKMLKQRLVTSQHEKKEPSLPKQDVTKCKGSKDENEGSKAKHCVCDKNRKINCQPSTRNFMFHLIVVKCKGFLMVMIHSLLITTQIQRTRR